jgi:hypothetical protein
MTVTAGIKTLIAANSAIMTLFTGGVYTDDETGRNGIGRSTTPAAYDADGFLQPCAYVKERAQIGNWGGAVGNSGFTGTRQVVEVWIYDDAAYTTIASARDLVFALLQRALITGYGRLRYLGFIKDVAPDLNDAPFFRLEFELIGLLGETE